MMRGIIFSLVIAALLLPLCASAERVEIPLKEGWNLISIPVVPQDNSIISVLSPIKQNCDFIFGYYSGYSKTWQRMRPDFLNDLKTLDPYHGYWIKINRGSTLVVEGTRPANTAINMFKGWNLIGYMPAQSMPIGQALQSIEGKYIFLMGYNAMASRPMTWDRMRPDFLNDLNRLDPYRGYWIKMSETTTLDWTYSQTGCSDGTHFSTCSATIPKYCDGVGVLHDNYCYGADKIVGNADDCGCLVGQTCSSDGSCTVVPTITNKKNTAKYSEKEVFLISDENWKDVLSLVPVTTWTQQDSSEGPCQRGYGTPNTVCVYPTLIYHGENKDYYSSESTKIPEGGYGTRLVKSGDFQTFKFSDSFLHSILFYLTDFSDSDFSKNDYNIRLETPSGNIILPKKIISWGQTSKEFIFDENINKEETYKIVFNVLNTETLAFSGSDKNPYANGYFNDPSGSLDLQFSIMYNLYKTESVFDIDSIIYFMQQYNTKKVTIIGKTPQELDNLLVTLPELGVGLSQNQLQRMSNNDYFSYWKEFRDVVYVEDNYETALMASTYASLMNAPLIIKGYNDNIDLSKKNVICVGSVIPKSGQCNILDSFDVNKDNKYQLEELQKKYVEKTKTDKIILVNPNDLNIFYNEEMVAIKTKDVISELYSKASLSAPILASAKHEVIINTDEKDPIEIKKGIIKITLLEPKMEYLTILSSPDVLPMSKKMNSQDLLFSLDNSYYTDTDNDDFAELSVGRIFGISSSDVSSYIARSLFYDSISIPIKNILIIGKDFPSFINQAQGLGIVLSSAGYNTNSFVGYPTAIPSDWKGKQYIAYLDHGNPEWAGIGSSEIPYLDSPFITAEACLTCAYSKAITKSSLFCANALRKGAIGFIGATDFGTSLNSKDFIYSLYAYDVDIGHANKERINDFIAYGKALYDNSGRNYEISNNQMLLGDPTLKLRIPTILSRPQISKEKDKFSIIGHNIYFKNNAGGLVVLSDISQSSMGGSGIGVPASNFIIKLPYGDRIDNIGYLSSDIVPLPDTSSLKYYMNYNQNEIYVVFFIYKLNKDIVVYDNKWHNMKLEVLIN
jgi:hypothetical protein